MAMAPEQVGIGIRRHFTRAGEHPYDTVTWELRDARIQNYKTGGDAFFQPEVEFPAGWSQNATNIVAQKYFRGQLGTAERERSLKQVIDRVSDTIANWGTADGYFTNAEEADAFRNELKYLLVHQRAAFNSPVWFNIGVKGVPAQASACFILAVEDHMSSILNWYVEEGTIFKGGSGSGINLSNIRSSMEPLAGGGTASGPVSFMRGADASAGTIKCLAADTPIVTSHGVVPIASVGAGWDVMTRHGWKTVTAVHDNGVRPLVKVRTALGDEITCTPEHQFRVRGPFGEEWRQAGDLRAGDYAIIDLGHTSHGKLQHLVAEEPSSADDGSFPAQLDEAFAVWLGWAHGERRLREVEGSGALAINLDGAEGALVERIRAFTQSIFGRQAAAQVTRGGSATPASVCPPRVARFLQANGLWRAGTSGLPRIVQSSPAGVRAAFLAGLFESDGHVQHGAPTLWTKRRALALDVHRLLLSIGIPSKVSQGSGTPTDTTGPVPTGGPGLWRVRVVGGEGLRRFAKLVGFVSETKARLLESALERPETFEPTWFFPHVGAEVSRLPNSELRRAVASGDETHTYGMSLSCAAQILEKFAADLDGPLVRFGQGDELYVPVTVEAVAPGPTFDLTVDGVHEYLVHGVVTHNSGGKTRRAAKMVILNVDHPDVESFIWCKTIEERKARALAAAGFDMDLDGSDSHSIQYQNANNSVRVSDDFMNAVVAGRQWDLKAVTSGETMKTVEARGLLRQIAQAAWECADPGMQFDTTINRWHTAPNTGRINASNPCFPGDARVHTDKGLIRFDELIDRVRAGEAFGVYTHDATSPDAPAERLEITKPEAFMMTGLNEIVKLTFSNGSQLRCTPNHGIFTANRGYVPAAELTEDDDVKVLDLPAYAVNADYRLPVSTDVQHYAVKGDWARSIELPEKWSEEFAHYLGWLVGDGCISGDVITTVYGGDEEQQEILPKHLELLTKLNGGQAPKPSVQKNGTVQLRQSRRVLARFFEALGVSHSKAPEKTIPWAIEQAPSEIVAAFLRGLFDADGCVYDGKNSRYVGLGSASPELLRGAQRLLSTFGIFARIYNLRTTSKRSFSYTRKDGTTVDYESEPLFDLRIANISIDRFLDEIGFDIQTKWFKLGDLTDGHRLNETKTTVRLVSREDDGVEQTYNLCEPRNHSYIVESVVIRNCSEYMHIDNSACNLASLNLLTFLGDDGRFDVDGFKAAVQVIFTAQEILVGNADYPTKKIGENSRKFRQLGIGYANLGALLMAQGLAYDSDEGRAWAAAITAIMTGHSYATSARTAGRMGPFAGYARNKDPMLKVLRMHRTEVEGIDTALVPGELLEAARNAWDDAVDLGEAYGVRNSQASVLAPTGTIGLMMDCDTTGIEPDLALTKAKKLVGGGTMFIVNQTIPRALRRMGYTPDQVERIIAYIDQNKTIVGAPDLSPDHLPVFACAMGDNVIHHMGHVKMMAAVQPFISGAISKCVVGETLLSTADGLVRIGSLHQGEAPDTFREELIEVASLGGARKTDAFYYGGTRPVREVVLASGQRVVGTPNHRLLVGDKDGLEWRRLDEIAAGEHVALRYGADMWSDLPALLPQGGPAEMTDDLAFLLGALAAGGEIDRSTDTVTIYHPWAPLVERLAGIWRSAFGVEPETTRLGALRPAVTVTSAAAIGFLDAIGAGDSGPDANIPAAVLQSTRDLVVTYLEGLFLVARPSRSGGAAALSVDHASAGLLDDLQAVLTNLGVVHHRGADGLEAHGDAARLLLDIVPLADPQSAGVAAEVGRIPDAPEVVADPVPGLSSRELYLLVPPAYREGFSFLRDEKTRTVSRRLLAEVALLPGVELPEGLRVVVDDGLHFSPVESVEDAGEREVYDVSVPLIHAFVANGIVNHNTINMPEEATVEEVEDLHIEAWKLGLKAIAIYRDNCKVAQPLSTQKKEGDTGEKTVEVIREVERVVETVIVQEPVRQKLPRRRNSKTFSFRVADCHGYATVGEFEDGRPGEIFLKVAKQGSTLAGIMDAFAISVSHGLQYGVPLKAFVEMFTNMRFEPAGMTDDPDIRLASSLIDYIFRRVAVEYIPYEERVDLGILTVGERMQPTLPGVEEATSSRDKSVDITPDGPSLSLDLRGPEPTITPDPPSAPPPPPPAAPPAPPAGPQAAAIPEGSRRTDAPYCYGCGMEMQRAGSCYVCSSCGTTSGCS